MLRATAITIIALAVAAMAGFSVSAKESSSMQMKRLDGPEIENLLLGTELSGRIHGYSTAWRGCIDPDGVTSRELDGKLIYGQFSVQDNLACFQYGDTKSCFAVLQYEGGHMLYARNVGFLIDEIVDDVDLCPMGKAGV